jgi:PTH1 family peptidyl-tRNA hydrolase
MARASPARGDTRAAGFESGGVEHNGLKSLKRELGGAEFARVRIGIGRPDSTDPEIVAGHVLGRWRQPREEVAALVARAANAAERILPALRAFRWSCATPRSSPLPSS